MTISYASERWFQVLLTAIRNNPRGNAGVADQMKNSGAKVSRTQISLVVRGEYKASTENIAEKVLAVFDRYQCRYLGTEIDAEACRKANAGDPPTWDPAALDQRRICQTCPNKPGDKQ